MDSDELLLSIDLGLPCSVYVVFISSLPFCLSRLITGRPLAFICILIAHVLLVDRCTRFARSSQIWSKRTVRAYEISLWTCTGLTFMTGEIGNGIAISQAKRRPAGSTPNYYILWITMTYLFGAASLLDTPSVILYPWLTLCSDCGHHPRRHARLPATTLGVLLSHI